MFFFCLKKTTLIEMFISRDDLKFLMILNYRNTNTRSQFLIIFRRVLDTNSRFFFLHLFMKCIYF